MSPWPQGSAYLKPYGKGRSSSHSSPRKYTRMNPTILAGTILVQFALMFYAIGVVIEQRRKFVSTAVVRFLFLGVIFDITATACMMIGTSKSLFTLHGILGYSSLVAMVTDTILLIRHRQQKGEAPVPRPLHIYSRIAYIWWVLAYLTGAALVMSSR